MDPALGLTDIPAYVPAGNGSRLRTLVPDGIFTLAIEADDDAAAAEHAAFADRCVPVLAPRQPAGTDLGTLRQSVIAELGTLRRAVAATGMGYLGALAGEHDGRAALILLSIAASPMEFPQALDPASLLAAIASKAYPGAAVEEFPAAERTGVGIRRCDELTLPLPEPALVTTAGLDRDDLRFDTGISQALVPFPEAGLLAAVTGYCLNPHDVDVATVFTATIAFRLSVVAD
jgi:hypothetical protein